MAVTFVVELEGRQPYDVDVDQRDYAAWEMQTFFGDRPVVRQRFLAFSASTRQGKTDLSWPKFNAAAVKVDVADDGDEEIDAGDPTRPGPSAEV